MCSRTSYCRRRASSALRTVLARVTGRRGRSSSVTLPSGARERTADSVLAVLRPPPVRTMTGKSDHAGCDEILCARTPMVPLWSTSSVRMTAPTSSEIAAHNCSIVGSVWTLNPDCCNTFSIKAASLPKGAKTSTGISNVEISAIQRPFLQQRRERGRAAGKDSLKIRERRSHVNGFGTKPKFTNRALMAATALLHHRDGLADLSRRLKIAEDQDIVCQVTHVDRSLHRTAYQAHLRQDHQRHHSAVVQVGKQFVQV